MTSSLATRWEALLAAVREELEERGQGRIAVEGDLATLTISIRTSSEGWWSLELGEYEVREAPTEMLAWSIVDVYWGMKDSGG